VAAGTPERVVAQKGIGLDCMSGTGGTKRGVSTEEVAAMLAVGCSTPVGAAAKVAGEGHTPVEGLLANSWEVELGFGMAVAAGRMVAAVVDTELEGWKARVASAASARTEWASSGGQGEAAAGRQMAAVRIEEEDIVRRTDAGTFAARTAGAVVVVAEWQTDTVTREPLASDWNMSRSVVAAGAWEPVEEVRRTIPPVRC